RLLPANPLGQIQWKASEVAETVDRRSVASPAQAGRLLKAIRGQGPRGEHMEAFFGCLYYAALRPAEAVALREADCVLPKRGWGRIDLAASCALRRHRVDRRRRQPRGTRPQAPRTRRNPQHPHPPRPLALPPAQQASPLARRPYDLRHAAVSLWLNAGVPATEVARRAGHGIAVLLKVYANCIDGQASAANQRINDALDEQDEHDREEPHTALRNRQRPHGARAGGPPKPGTQV